jgi:hypothetical protein
VPASICTACGTEYPDGPEPPPDCRICEEERQFVPEGGQGWTTIEALARRHSNFFRQHEANLLALETTPHFAIGQRAFLVRSEHGNVLWDCLALLDLATETLIHALGGLSAIAISHPHYYTTMHRWSEAFDAPVYLHEADRQWVVRPAAGLAFWEGEIRELLPGLTLIRCGGHFAGGTVLHWADGAQGRGAILSGDVLQVLPDRKHVSFMRSYPNLMPLSAPVVERVAGRLAPYSFERIYGAFAGREILADGKAALLRSAHRYACAVSGNGPADAEI